MGSRLGGVQWFLGIRVSIVYQSAVLGAGRTIDGKPIAGAPCSVSVGVIDGQWIVCLVDEAFVCLGCGQGHVEAEGETADQFEHRGGGEYSSVFEVAIWALLSVERQYRV